MSVANPFKKWNPGSPTCDWCADPVACPDPPVEPEVDCEDCEEIDGETFNAPEIYRVTMPTLVTNPFFGGTDHDFNGAFLAGNYELLYSNPDLPVAFESTTGDGCVWSYWWTADPGNPLIEYKVIVFSPYGSLGPGPSLFAEVNHPSSPGGDSILRMALSASTPIACMEPMILDTWLFAVSELSDASPLTISPGPFP